MEPVLKILKKIILVSGLLFCGLLLHAQNEQENAGIKTDSLSRALPDTIPPVAVHASYLNSPILYPARDSIVISMADKKIRMYGAARVTYEKTELTADYIEMSIDRKEVWATGLPDSTGNIVGTPVFSEGEQKYETNELRYNFETKKAYVIDVRMQEEESFLHSHITKMDSLGVMNIKDGKFTTCNAPEPHFHFQITKGKVIPDKVTVTGPLYLVVEGIPLPLALPFGYLPKQKKQASGILMPQYGEERNRGFYLRNGGYYFALNEKLDLSVTGDIYSRGSWKLGTQSNYKKIYRFSGNVNLNVANNVTGEKGLPNYKKQNDFSVRWTHNQDPKAHPYRTFNANVNFSTSSYDKLNTYNNYSNVSSSGYDPYQHLTNTKSSSISFNRKFPNKLFNFTAKLGHNQNSNTQSVSLDLPSATFTVGRINPFKRAVKVGKTRWYEKIEMRYSSSFENKIKAHEDTILNPNTWGSGNILDYMQNGFKHSVPVSASFKPIRNMTLTPSLNYDGLLYFSHVNKYWDIETDSLIVERINKLNYVQTLAPNINLSYAPMIYGFFTFNKGRVQAIRHVMSPSISVGYRPDLGYDFSKYRGDTIQVDKNGTMRDYGIFDEGLYRIPSVAGRYGSVNFSLGNSVEMKVKNPKDTTNQIQKVKLLESLSLSTTYDIFRDSMNLTPISLNGRTRLLNQIDLSFRSTFDPYTIDSVRVGTRTSLQRINTFEIIRSGKPVRMTDASISLSFSLPIRNNQSRGATQRPSQNPDNPQAGLVDFKIPWSLRVNYNFNYRKPLNDITISQTLNFTGDVNLSEKWKVSFTSGWDFERKEVVYTSFGIHRDLHCWEMNITVVPFGERKSYMFSISAKGSLLKDVKYNKEKSWFDN